MSSVEEIRSAVISTVNTLHTTNFPLIPINYPNRFTVDLETFAGTYFVTVSLATSESVESAAVGGTETDITGTLTLTTVFKTNTGLNGTANYTSMLVSNLLFKQISGVSYLSMKAVETSPYPGFKGIANIIKFRVI